MSRYIVITHKEPRSKGLSGRKAKRIKRKTSRGPAPVRQYPESEYRLGNIRNAGDSPWQKPRRSR